MAYYGAGYTAPSEGVFGGFPGGYNQSINLFCIFNILLYLNKYVFFLFLVPGGAIIPPNTNVLGAGYPSALGANLPSVNPNTFPGLVHFGQPTVITEPQIPLNAGVVDPNLYIAE